MSRSVDTLKPKQALLIKCEGEVTEPLFFDGFRKLLPGFVFTISPEPRYVEADLEPRPSRGGKQRKRRQIKGEPIEDTPRYGMPLNWVMEGLEKLDSYEEVWCVFDKDGHPRAKEAFETVQQHQEQGDNINIAFSSRCIEYYFLLHFEYIYKAFSKCECGEKDSKRKKTVYFKCVTPEAVPHKACMGDRCINGYARSKGYWQESKQEDESMFPLIEDKLWIGIRNSILLRRESYAMDPISPIYQRNPYVTVDHLVARLLGYAIMDANEVVKVDGTNISVAQEGQSLIIGNVGGVAYSIQENLLNALDVNTGDISPYNPKPRLLLPGETENFELESDEERLYILSLGSKKYIVANV